MQAFLLDLLICPACRGALEWRIAAREGQEIEEADARCRACGAEYPVREGIGAFLTPDLTRNDLWEEVDSGLARYLRDNPEVERRLLESPLSALNPADRFFRGYVLEERGRFADAQTAIDAARPGLYTAEATACMERLATALLEAVGGTAGPVVDIASGRGFLVERLARAGDRPVVATDFSISALRRNRKRFSVLGLGEQVSFLAVDARRTPFADAGLPLLTTYLGLPNIEEPGPAVGELRRITAGSFYAVSCLYEDGDRNEPAIRALGTPLALRSELLGAMESAGWRVEIAEHCPARMAPTPRGEIIDAGIDTIPEVETVADWVLLRAVPA